VRPPEPRESGDCWKAGGCGVRWQVVRIRLGTKGWPEVAVKVYLGGAPAGQGEMIYEQADAFSVTAGGFLLIQRQHSGAQMDLAVFAPNAWLRAEVVPEPAPGVG
jgi:hypothetical protein